MAIHNRADHGIRLGEGSLCLSQAEPWLGLPSVQTLNLIVTRSPVPHNSWRPPALCRQRQASRQDGAYHPLSWTCACLQPSKAENKWHHELSESPNTVLQHTSPYLAKPHRESLNPAHGDQSLQSLLFPTPAQGTQTLSQRDDPHQKEWEAPSNLRVNDGKDLSACSLLGY